MKKVVLLLGVLIFSARPVFAFIHFTQPEFTTAESLDPGMTQTGIHFAHGERYNSYYPEIRYGLGALTEVGVKFGATEARLGLSDSRLGSDDKLGALVGVDLKYQLIKETEGIPIDMAVDLGVDNTIINRKNVTEVTFSTIFSKAFPLTDRGYKFVPYVGLEMAAIYGSGVPDKDTSLHGFVGMEWKLSQKFMFLLEYKGGEGNIGGIGIRFEY